LQRQNKDKTYEPALACLQSLFMITIRDHGSSQLIRPEDTASGLVMAQSAEEPVAKEDRAQGGFSTFRTSEEAVGDLWSREPRTATCHHVKPTGYGKSLTRLVREVLQPPEPPKKPNALEVCGAGSREPGAATCHHEMPTGYGESLTHGKGGFQPPRPPKIALV
jgi:hypothetical protein